MREFISFQKSIEIINSLTKKNLVKEKIYILDSIDRILAQDIIANTNNPEYETSSMDGYAYNSQILDSNTLKILCDNPAGGVVETAVGKNECIKTFTGSLMPKDCDTLIPIENVKVIDDTIEITKPVKRGTAVRKVGENFKKGEVLIKKGTKISFSEIGVLASLNIVNVSVYKKPTVSIASTGSEILDLGEAQTNPSQIRSSNHLTLSAISKKSGADIIQCGVVEDDIESITSLLQDALETSDIIVTTGGVSVGDYDFVQDVIKEKLDAKVLFHGVLMKPGQHILVACKEDKVILALPGFAYSSTVCALLYLVPLIYKYSGNDKKLPTIKAIIDEEYNKKGNKVTFSACNKEIINGEYHINFKNKKEGSSAILTNLLHNSNLLIIDEDTNTIKKGEEVNIIPLDMI